MQKSILIIGGGIAGLAAGCYGQMNGYRTQIFELHNMPGGLCTAWERQGYVFDGCIQYLIGSGEGQPFNYLWQELGVARGWKIINHEELMRVVDSSGRSLIGYADPDRLEDHMLELSPADSYLIKKFTAGVRNLKHFDLSALKETPRPIMSPEDWRILGAKMMPFVGPLARWGFASAQDFARRFKDPFLRRAIPALFGWGEIPTMAGMLLLAYMSNGNAGFPAGASLNFARTIEQRYQELGGEIHYNSQVEKILVENGCAVGIRLYNDDIYHGDYIISAADGRNTIFELLDGRFTNRRIRRMYDGHLPLYSQAQISLGVDRDLSADPHWATYLLDEPLLIAGEEHPEIAIKNYCYDPSLAPPGKSCLVFMMRSHYGYWQRIYGHRLYDTEQTQVSDIVTDFLERYYPGIHTQIEVVDETTPLSYERYTGNWQGSSCGWLLTKGTLPMLILGVNKTLPGLRDFYMAGHWVEPGGMVPMAAVSGRNVIQLICHAEGQRFTTMLG